MTDMRRATPDDVAGIAGVVHSVWEQALLVDVCRAHMRDETCSLWVAAERGRVLGFASAFLTTSRRGDRRWEIDLVAVKPDSQGQGLGQRLIAATCDDGREHRVTLARALIRVDNIPSQRAFEKADFATDGEVHCLLLWPPERATADKCRPLRIAPTLVGRLRTNAVQRTNGVRENRPYLPVDTLTYRGLWIEGLENMTAGEQRAVVGAARSIIAREGRLNTGAVIPADKEPLLASDLRDQAKVHGEYYWFVKRKT